MQIDVATPAMIRREMKNRVHALHGCARNARFTQVCVGKLNLSRRDMSLDVVAMPARQIIDDSNLCAAREKMIRKRRADERSPSRHQDKLSSPKILRRRHAFKASSIIFTNFCNSLTLS